MRRPNDGSPLTTDRHATDYPRPTNANEMEITKWKEGQKSTKHEKMEPLKTMGSDTINAVGRFIP